MLVAVASAKGSPGVTTTSRVLASVWPGEVVLADCDPAGGDVALLGRGHGGTVLDPDRGLLSLAAAARRGLGADALEDHVQVLDGGLRVLVGVTHPEQVTGIGPVWPALATAFASVSGTVIADCGRVVPGTPVLPLLTGADVVVMVVRQRVEAYAHLRERLRWLASVQPGLGGGPAVGVVVVTEPRDTEAVRELSGVLARAALDARVIGRVAEDRRAADTLAGRADRGIARSLLVRSARVLVDPLRSLASTRTRI